MEWVIVVAIVAILAIVIAADTQRTDGAFWRAQRGAVKPIRDESTATAESERGSARKR